jgi:hypothetical protein
MRARRTQLVTVLALAASGAGASGAAGATPPVGTCPPSFDGPLTFEQVVAKYPPPPGLPDPIGALARFDKNADGSVCVLDIPGDPINVIDNIARVPS